MTIFNPEISANLGDNYTTRSQGQTPNKALGLLFSAVGDAVSSTIKAQKEKKDDALANEIQKGVDKIGEESLAGNIFDAPDADPSKRHVGGAGSESKNFAELPTDLQEAETKLKRLTMAKGQTGMSDVYYNMQVAALLKRMNTLHPGKEAEIAALTTRATGISTANAIRKETLAILNAEGSAADAEDKRKKQILKENPEYLADPYVMTQYEKANGGKPFNPTDYNENALLYAIGTRKFEDSSVDRKLKAAQVEEVGSKGREKAFTTALTEQVQVMSDRLLYTSLNTAQEIRGLDTPQTSIDFRNIQEMIQKTTQGGTIATPEQITAIRNQLNMLDVQMSSALDGLINNYATEVTSATERNNIKKLGMAPIEIMKQAFAGPNPDLGIIGAAKAAVENQNNAFILQNGRFEKQLDLAKKIWGDDVSILLGKQFRGEPLSSEEQAQFNSLKLYLAEGKSLSEMLSQTKKDETLTQDQVSKLVPTAIQQHLEMILQSKDPAAVQKAASSIYNEDERKVIEKNARANPDSVFKMLVSPEMTEKLKGTPAFENYANFARYQARPIMQQWADTAADVQANTGSGVVTWDEAKGRFSYQLDRSKLPTGQGFGPAAARDWDLYQADKGRVAVESINSYLDRMQGIFDATGDTPAGFMQAFFGSQSFKKMEKKGSLLDRANQGLNSWLKSNEEKMRKENPGIENFDIEQQQHSPLGTTPTGSTTQEQSKMLEDTMAAPNLIAEFEGFREKPYWDVNAWRVGFGTDTYVDAEGKTQRVTKNTKVTKDQAMADLLNRVTNFEQEAAYDMGDTWNKLDTKQRAALASVAYNYGSLPKNLVSAVKSGDKGKIQAAFAKLSEHNDGVNKKRRQKELKVFLGIE